MIDDSAFELRSTSNGGDAVVFTIVGEVDMTTSPELTKALASVVGTVRRVVVDLSGVIFLDSSGLSALVRGRRELGVNNVDLRVVAPPSSIVRRVIEVAQLNESLSPVDSLDALV